MKYCSKCGAQIHDDAVVCIHCGCSVEKPHSNTKTMQSFLKFFMILSCVVYAVCIIPLCWLIPMTISTFKKIERNEPFSMAFSICTFLFANAVAGVLMMCYKNEIKQ